MTLLQGDIRELAKEPGIHKADIVCSTSVFEHLGDPTGVLDALVSLTAEKGIHLHYIDLRDHFFKYPVEMLTFPEKTWKNWLNPTSNLNRWRLPAYEGLFQADFPKWIFMCLNETNLPGMPSKRERSLNSKQVICRWTPCPRSGLLPDTTEKGTSMDALLRNLQEFSILGVWCAFWLVGGYGIARYAFRIPHQEQVLTGIALGLIVETWLANFLTLFMPAVPAFWLAAVLTFVIGIIFSWGNSPRDWLKLTIPWGQLLLCHHYLYIHSHVTRSGDL